MSVSVTLPITLSDRAAAAPDLRDCIRCGLCLESCPTYLELGLEPDSPRGRIAIMRGLRDGRLPPTLDSFGHLDLCLDCRACETACPSGVRYGALIEHARETTSPLRHRSGGWWNRLRDYVIFEVLPNPRRLSRWLGAWRWLEAAGLPDFLNETGVPAALGLPRIPRLPDTADAAEQLPHNPSHPSHLSHISHGLWDRRPAGQRQAGGPSHKDAGRSHKGVEIDAWHATPADSASAGSQLSAALFVGCVSEVLTPRTNRATIRVLRRGGWNVEIPAGQGCCGAIHHHAGRAEEARRLARTNIDAFDADGDAPLVANAAGCGAMLKHYGELLADDPGYAARARRFAGRVRDVNEFVAERLLGPHPDPLPWGEGSRPLRVVYHDACHLCHAQRIRAEPRRILEAIPGVRLIPLVESEVCCGAAGTYGLTQPEMSARLARRKWSHLSAARPDVIATANVGCILQLMQHAPDDLRSIPIVHPIELLDQACG